MRYELHHGVKSRSSDETVWHVFDRYAQPEMARKHGRELYAMGVDKLKIVDTKSMHEEAVAANHVGDASGIAGIGNTASDPPVKKKKKLKDIIRRVPPCQTTRSM